MKAVLLSKYYNIISKCFHHFHAVCSFLMRTTMNHCSKLVHHSEWLNNYLHIFLLVEVCSATAQVKPITDNWLLVSPQGVRRSGKLWKKLLRLGFSKNSWGLSSTSKTRLLAALTWTRICFCGSYCCQYTSDLFYGTYSVFDRKYKQEYLKITCEK